MKPARVLERISELEQIGKDVATTLRSAHQGYGNYVDPGKINGFRSAVLSFVELHFGKSHTYYAEFVRSVPGHDESHLKSGMAILSAIRGEVAGGWLDSVKSLVAAEIFSDFLEMAEHLLSANYKDPAAVMIGSTLEEHMRRLANTNGVPTTREVDGEQRPKKAEMLNADLAAAAVYTKLDQKAITGWLGLRNKAAHGEYDQYQKSQVEIMLQGVTDFMARVT